MSRDVLRSRVKLFLGGEAEEGKQVKAQAVQMVFPGFEKYVGQLSEYTLDTVPTLLKDSSTAMKAGYGGYILLGGLVNAIRDGKDLLTAEDLRDLKGKLLDLADQIDDLTMKNYEDEPAEEDPEDTSGGDPEEGPGEDPGEDPEEDPEEGQNLRKPARRYRHLHASFIPAQAVGNEDCDSPPLSHATISNKIDRGENTGGAVPFDVGAALGADRPRW